MIHVSDVTMTVQAISAVFGAVFAFAAWRKGRENATAIAANTAKTNETHDLVNSNSKLVLGLSEAAAFRAGVEHADSTDAKTLADALTEAAKTTDKINGGSK